MGAHRRIGVLGGTFNPIHNGHLILAQTAFERHELQKVLFVPCAAPPHKQGSPIAGQHRAAMVELAIEDDLRFEMSDVELARGGTSYAIDTVAELKRRDPEAELCFIIGADTLPELHLWRHIYTLLTLCRFITFGRPGSVLDTLTPESLRLDPPWATRLLDDAAYGRQIDISSTDIRHRIAEGLSIRYLVPTPVEVYIAEHGLYLA